MKLRNLTLTFVGLSVAMFAVPQAAKAVSLSVIADGLDNPRNFDWDSQGNLYMALSGKGGDGDGGQKCIASPSAQYIPLCSGNTGSLIKIAPDGTRTTVLGNLPSLALVPSGEQGAGPADFKFDKQGNAYLLMGLAGNPQSRDTTLGTPDLGKLFKVDLGTGSLTSLADFGAYELANNPDGTDFISNPYAFAIKGDNAYVVDGGGNTIYKVGLDGSGIKNVKAIPEQQLTLGLDQFPQLPEGLVNPVQGDLPPGFTEAANGLPQSNQSVPTSIAIAPDGSLTLAEYTYFPYPEGKARVWSIDDNLTTTGLNVAGKPQTGTEIATGFTQLTGITYDSEGNMYALQHINSSEWKEIQQGGVITGDISGSIIKIAKDGTRSTIWSGNGLEAASGLEFGPDGNLYTANRARLAETGQLVRINLKGGSEGRKVPEPATIAGLVAFSALATRLRKRKQQEELGEELLAKVETV